MAVEKVQVSQLRVRDRDSFQSLKDEQKPNGPREIYSQRMVREAASAESLTGDENWDLFVSYVQGLLKTAQGHKDAIDTQLTEEPIFDHMTLLRLKNQSMLLTERIHTISEILQIPSVIKREGEDGLRYLSTLNQDKGAPAKASGKEK